MDPDPIIVCSSIDKENHDRLRMSEILFIRSFLVPTEARPSNGAIHDPLQNTHLRDFSWLLEDMPQTSASPPIQRIVLRLAAEI